MQPLKIYYDGKLDRRATYMPLIKHRIADMGWAINDYIAELQSK